MIDSGHHTITQRVEVHISAFFGTNLEITFPKQVCPRSPSNASQPKQEFRNGTNRKSKLALATEAAGEYAIAILPASAAFGKEAAAASKQNKVATYFLSLWF